MSQDKKIARVAVEMGLISESQAAECLRIVTLRGDIGQPTSLDRVLFERRLASADDVYRLQGFLAMRLAFCPKCPTRINTWGSKAGSSIRCDRCSCDVPVPGFDPRDPFKVRPRTRARELPPTRAELAAGLLAVLLVGGLLGVGARDSWTTHMGIPAAGACAGYGLAVLWLGRTRRLLAAAGVGLALFTGLVVASALGGAPGQPGFAAFDLPAHRLIPPLVLGHAVVLFVAAAFILERASGAAYLGLVFPALYGLMYFTLLSVPGQDPTALFSGPGFLRELPWFLHPATVTLLFLFPLGAATLLLGGVVDLFRGRRAPLLRRIGPVVGALLLAGFGVTVGSLRGEVPAPRLRDEVQHALRGRISPYWTAAGSDEPLRVASTAAALSPAAPR